MEVFKIFIDRLKGGQTVEMSGEVAPDFMAVKDGGLVFDETVSFHGKAYLADDHLVCTLDASTTYKTRCKICNELLPIPLDLQGIYITEEIQNISSKIYDVKEALREAILVEIPMYHECGGNCPERANIQQYLTRN